MVKNDPQIDLNGSQTSTRLHSSPHWFKKETEKAQNSTKYHQSVHIKRKFSNKLCSF